MRIQAQSSLLIIKEEAPTISKMPYGEVFKVNGKFLMRVKPTSFLLNSNLVGDVLNRGDCFIVDIEKGTLYISKGDTQIQFVDATMVIRES